MNNVVVIGKINDTPVDVPKNGVRNMKHHRYDKFSEPLLSLGYGVNPNRQGTNQGTQKCQQKIVIADQSNVRTFRFVDGRVSLCNF